MGQAIDASRSRLDRVLAAASGASACAVHLVEAARSGHEINGMTFASLETVEHLAEALRILVRLEMADARVDPPRRAALCRFSAALEGFLTGWDGQP